MVLAVKLAFATGGFGWGPLLAIVGTALVIPVVLLLILGRVVDHRDALADYSSERPDGPRAAARPEDDPEEMPSWWPEFEREFADYVATRKSTRSGRRAEGRRTGQKPGHEP